MTDGETKQMIAVLAELGKLKTAEASKIVCERARDQFRLLSEVEANKTAWFVGQKVRLKSEHQNSKPYDTVGTVVKVNRKNLQVNFGMYSIWNVPKTMLDGVI